jgi:hypothetical protein
VLIDVFDRLVQLGKGTAAIDGEGLELLEAGNALRSCALCSASGKVPIAVAIAMACLPIFLRFFAERACWPPGLLGQTILRSGDQGYREH